MQMRATELIQLRDRPSLETQSGNARRASAKPLLDRQIFTSQEVSSELIAHRMCESGSLYHMQDRNKYINDEKKVWSRQVSGSYPTVISVPDPTAECEVPAQKEIC